MAFVDYFPKQLVVDPSTGQPVPGAQLELYAMSDTAMAFPLSVVDMLDQPISVLTAGPTGITPDFKCPGYRQLLAKSGDLTTPLFSLAIAFEAFPDPTGQAPALSLSTDGVGGWMLTPIPGAGSGIRSEITHATGSIAAAGRESGVVALGDTSLVLRVQVDRSARVRLYDTIAHRDIDATRAIGVDPDPLENTGVMLDIELEPGEAWTLTPPAAVGSFLGDGTVPIIVDNISASIGAVTVTFTAVSLEGV